MSMIMEKSYQVASVGSSFPGKDTAMAGLGAGGYTFLKEWKGNGRTFSRMAANEGRFLAGKRETRVVRACTWNNQHA